MIDKSPTKTEIIQGHNVLLHCQTHGQPIPTIIWTYGENVSYPIITSDRFTVLPGGNLFIQDASINDTGMINKKKM